MAATKSCSSSGNIWKWSIEILIFWIMKHHCPMNLLLKTPMSDWMNCVLGEVLHAFYHTCVDVKSARVSFSGLLNVCSSEEERLNHFNLRTMFIRIIRKMDSTSIHNDWETKLKSTLQKFLNALNKNQKLNMLVTRCMQTFCIKTEKTITPGGDMVTDRKHLRHLQTSSAKTHKMSLEVRMWLYRKVGVIAAIASATLLDETWMTPATLFSKEIEFDSGSSEGELGANMDIGKNCKMQANKQLKGT